MYHRDRRVPSRRPRSDDDPLFPTVQRHRRRATCASASSAPASAASAPRSGSSSAASTTSSIFERAADVGGTWWANTYPGCQCDIPSHLYSFSFAPNPNWTRTYPKQPELRDYLRATAEKFGLYDRIRFNTEVTDARWDEDGEPLADRDQRTAATPPTSWSPPPAR